MLELNRIGCEVYCGEKKLTIVKQETKGAGKEVVKIDGLQGSNGKKWLSLKLLQEGLNVISDDMLVKRVISKGYELTDEEQSKIDELNSQIDELDNQINKIIEIAKIRYVEAHKEMKISIPRKKNTNKMNVVELENYIEDLQVILATKKDKEFKSIKCN